LLGKNAHSGMRRLGVVAALAALISLAVAPWGSAPDTARAVSPETAVLDWNRHAASALMNATATATPPGNPPGAGQPPPVAASHLAMVQGAVYDAVNMIDGGYEPYLADLPPASADASKANAVARAAHDVLVGLGRAPVPALPQVTIDWLDAEYDALDLSDTDPGVLAGAAAAQAMLEARDGDGRYVPDPFDVGTDAGEWRPTQPGGVNDPFAWVRNVTPFLLEDSSQLRTKGPHSLTSGAYTKEYSEVKDLGGNGTASTPNLRTPEQTALARFYIVNPVEMFNRTFRTIAQDEALTLVEQARLFAMLNLAGADSLISCWDDKAFWSFWRPITAIQSGDTDGNPRTDADPAWTPFINTLSPGGTPPYPDHPSGYNCVTSSMMYTAEAFFGKKKLPFTVRRTAAATAPPDVREYECFTDVIDDTIDARIYLGIHFRAPDVQGADIGQGVAHWLDKHYFQKAK
jgi:hypothetical protein